MSAAGPGVIFNFDNADIYEVIRVMAEIMKINYLVDPRVKGTVNIHTTGQLPGEEVFPIFQSILRLNGATAVKKDGLYEIVPLSDAKKTYVPPTTIRGGAKLASEEKYTIQIVSLKYIPATEASKLIKPFLSDGAAETSGTRRRIACRHKKIVRLLRMPWIDRVPRSWHSCCIALGRPAALLKSRWNLAIIFSQFSPPIWRRSRIGATCAGIAPRLSDRNCRPVQSSKTK